MLWFQETHGHEDFVQATWTELDIEIPDKREGHYIHSDGDGEMEIERQFLAESE